MSFEKITSGKDLRQKMYNMGKKHKKNERYVTNSKTSRKNEEKETVVELLKLKKCPKLDKPNWDCGKMKLRKGEEYWCNGPEYINCPSYSAYIDNMIISLIYDCRRKRTKKK